MDVLAVLDQDLEAGDVTALGPVATFARLCFQSLSGCQAGALGAFPPILKRLVTRSAILSPEKPQWLIEAEVVLHLSERMLGLSRSSASESEATLAIQVHRTRRRACGTYSTPNYVADHLCAAVFLELGQRFVGSQPLRVVDLSAEAGHFALAALAFPNRPPLEFFALDRDPEAIALLRAIHDYAGPRNSGPAFRLDAQIADSILGAPLSSHLGRTDAVIGNPPWKTMHPTDKRAYAERYSGFLRGRFDVYQAFLLRADELLRPGGILALAVPSSLLYTDNACEVRRYLRDRYHPIQLEIYPRRTFVELPSVTPIVLILKKRKPGERWRRKLRLPVYRSLKEDAKPARIFRLNTRTAWRGEGRAVWSVCGTAAERFTVPKNLPRIGLTEMGLFTSGAKLSSTKRVETDVAFHAIGAKAVCPFFVDVSACSYYSRGLAAFDRPPRTDLVDKSKVVFQTVRCVSMPRRLVAAAAGSGQLACSTAAMFVPKEAAYTAFLTGLLNTTYLNAWYKARDHHHAIKISVLAELVVPEDTALWREIGRVAEQIATAQRTLHDRGPTCGPLCTKDQTLLSQEDEALFKSTAELEEMVFDLYHVPLKDRGEFEAFSALDCF